MQSLPAVALHFANLVWLLAHRREHQDEQKELLRLTLKQLTEKRRGVALHDIALYVASTYQNESLADEVVWLSELSIRMSAHSVREIEFDRDAPPVEVLGIARALTEAAVGGDEGMAFDDKILALSLTRVTVHIGKSGFVRRATPAIAQRAVAARARTPVADLAAIPASPGSAFQSATQTAVQDGGPKGESGHRATKAARTTTHEMLAQELTGVQGRARDLKDLLGRLQGATDPSTAVQVIDSVAREAEERGREGLLVDMTEVLHCMHQRHNELHDGDLQRAFRQGIRRLEKPALMHAMAKLLPNRREMRDKITQLLAVAGEVGADALIDLLVNTDVTAERKAYRVALAHCPAAVPALLHLLGDERWYVVRNAVELLGELGPREVETPIAALLHHGEPRVRRSAAAALAKLGTPRAVLALLQGVPDPSPEVRMQVAIGLGAVRNPRAVPWLIEAFDKEQNVEVQGAMLAALGRMPTEEAVARLARAAEPGGILMRKASGLRLHAVEALAEAGTPGAHSVLRGLQKDRDRAVRDAANRALHGTVAAADS